MLLTISTRTSTPEQRHANETTHPLCIYVLENSAAVGCCLFIFTLWMAGCPLWAL